MSINFKPLQNATTLNSAQPLAHELIGDLYSKLIIEFGKDVRDDKKISELFQSLGIDPKDHSAMDEMSALLSTLNKTEIVAKPLVSGAFLLCSKIGGKEIAVFKVGRKRCSMELACRRLAHLLGLSKHITSGMFCSMMGLPLDERVKKEETTESLWNGEEKYYLCNGPETDSETGSYSDGEIKSDESGNGREVASEGDDTTGQPFKKVKAVPEGSGSGEEDSEVPVVNPFARHTTENSSEGNNSADSSEVTGSGDEEVWDDDTEYGINETSTKNSPEKTDLSSTVRATVGIVQPFLSDQPKADLYEFTLMTIVALAIGLRDGKKDGYEGSTMFDIEDSFPVRIDPDFSTGFMESAAAIHLPYLDQEENTFINLSKENIVELAKLVSKWNIAEIVKEIGRLKIIYEDKIAEEMQINTRSKDEGGFDIQIMESESHEINGKLNLCLENAKHRVFLPNQLDAVNTRLTRIRDFIQNCVIENKVFMPAELFDAVDTAGKVYRDRINTLKADLDSPQKIALESNGTFNSIGNRRPRKWNLKPRTLFKDIDSSGNPLGQDFNISSEDCGFGTPSDGNPGGNPGLKESSEFGLGFFSGESDTEK